MDSYRKIQQIVANAIINKFNFLKELNFEVDIDYEDENLFSKYKDLRITFLNESTNREVRFIYTHFGGENDDEIIESFSVYIGKNDTHSIFLIESYMKFIQKKEIKFLYLDSFDGGFDERLEQLLDYVKDICQTYLMPVIRGEEWVNVPMDWYGTR